MSQILRHSKDIYFQASRYLHVIKCGARYSSCITPSLNKPKTLLQYRHCLQSSCLFLSHAEKVQNNFPEESNSSNWLDQKLYEMDLNVRKIGRLRRSQVKKLIEEMKLKGSATSSQALLVIRCCGQIIPDTLVSERTKMVQGLWDMLLKQGCPMDISHYNALLKIHLENEHKFDPIAFLTTLEQKKIDPNRVTYLRLISRYCQDGDIEGASKILEFMKDRGLPVNESIFNELVIGHAKANNMDDAKAILEVMRNSELNPSSTTYCMLARGYAMSGDIEGIMATLQEAEAKDGNLIGRELLSIIYELAINDNGHLIEQILTKLQANLGYNNDCLNTILELVNRGHHQIGFRLLQTMIRGRLQDGSLAPTGLFFIRQIVNLGLPADVIIDYCAKLRDSDQNCYGLVKATELSLVNKQLDHTFSFLKAMKSEGSTIRTHFFWPIFVAKKGSSQNEIYDVLKLMVDLEQPANFDTFVDYAYPILDLSDPDAVVNKLKEIGYTVKDTVNSLGFYFILKSKLKTVLNLLEKYPIRISRWASSAALANACAQTKDVSSAMKILEYIKENPEVSTPHESKIDIFGQFLFDYLKSEGSNDDGVALILKSMAAKGFKLSSLAAEGILEKVKNNQNHNFMMLIESVTSSDVPDLQQQRKSAQSLELNFMSIEELESLLQDRKNRDANVRDVALKLLLKHIRQRNLQRVEEILKDLDETGLIYSPNLLSMLLDLNVYFGNLEQAMKYHNLILNTASNFKIDNYKIINLVNLLVTNKKFDEAEKILTAHFLAVGLKERLSDIESNIHRLLATLANAGEPEQAKRFFEIFQNVNACEAKNRLLGLLVKAHLVKNDVNGAVKEFLRLQEAHKTTPSVGELLRTLIKLEDSQNLQLVVDAASRIHGEPSTLLQLACAFLECGRIKQAKTVLETPGLRLHEDRIEYICGKYVDNNQISELETLIKIMKEVFEVNRERMYYHLIRAYARAENVEKAIGAWVNMQEENIHPSDHTLHFLGTFLQRMNQTLPFSMPKEPEKRNPVISRTKGRKDESERSYRPKLVRNGVHVGEVSLAIEDHLNKSNFEEATKLCEQLLSEGCFPYEKVLRNLTRKLAEAGDVNSLSSLLQKFTDDPGKIPVLVGTHICVAFIRSGHTEELLRSLEIDTSKYKDRFPAACILEMLRTQPETFGRVRKLADQYNQLGSLAPTNMLWMHLMLSKEYKQANDVLQSCPELNMTLRFRGIINRAKEDLDIDMSQALVDQVRGTKPADQGLAYSAHITILLSLNKLDEATTFFKDVQTIGLDNFKSEMLQQLHQELKLAEKPTLFIPPQGKTRKADSSSSDSDREKS